MTVGQMECKATWTWLKLSEGLSRVDIVLHLSFKDLDVEHRSRCVNLYLLPQSLRMSYTPILVSCNIQNESLTMPVAGNDGEYDVCDAGLLQVSTP